MTTNTDWHIYLIKADDDSLYCGISTDVKRRLHEHQSGKGAKYFRGRKALEVMFTHSHLSRSTASQLEWKVKRLSRKNKIALIEGKLQITEL